MNKFTRLLLAAVSAFALVPSSQAAIVFTGTPFFSQPPSTSPPGALVNIGPGLVLTPNATGFSLAGQVQVTIPPGPSTGILLSWEALYQIDTFLTTPQSVTTSNIYVGFIVAPTGNLGSTGVSLTDIYDGTSSLSGSQAVSGVAYPGPGLTPFNVTQTSGFFYTPSGTEYLRQFYSVDWNYNDTVPGVYVLDFPVDSTLVPEPGTALLGGVALLALVAGSRRRTQAVY